MRHLFALLLVLSLSACAFGVPRIPADGEVMGRRLQTTVDSPLAQYYLQDYLAGRRTAPHWDEQLDRLHSESDLVFRDNHHVKTLSREYSVDTLALYFALRLLEKPENRQIQALFEQQLALLDSPRSPLHTLDESLEQRYRVIFVPGWLYRSKPWTGADFAGPRAILDRMDIDNHFIELLDNGTIEANAEIIANALLPLLEDGKPTIIISGSKGGPETAIALGQLLTAQQLRPVQAWINICGALEGSPLADIWTSWPSNWLSWPLFQLRGYGNLEGLKSMRTMRSHLRNKSLKIPDEILIVNYLGVPVSGVIIEKEFEKRFTYSQLRDYGPNDGLVLIPDEIEPNGITVTELGRGHFLSEPDFDVRTIALLSAVLLQLNGSQDKSVASTAGPVP